MRALRVGGWALVTALLVTGQASAAAKIKVIQGRPIIDGVYLNNHGPYRFLVDTGTTLNHLDPKLARSIGLAPTFHSKLLSSTGTTSLPGAEGVDIALESAHAANQTFLFGGLEAIHGTFPGIQGVLGQEFLSRFDYLLDLRNQLMEFGAGEPQPAKPRQAFQTVSGRPVVATSLGSLVLDSGTASVTLFGVQPTAITRQMFTMTGPSNVSTVLRNLIIDGRTFWRGEAVVVPNPVETGAAGLLPASLFKAVYVSNSGRYVAFQ